MTIRETPSPNHDARPDGTATDMLILHYTGMRSAADAVGRLTDPDAKVSAHWVIEEDGTVHRLVDEERRAWHAGRAFWRGATDINARSIGVEIVNPGHEFGYRPFPDAQMAAVEHLCRGILDRHPIPPSRVLGHSDVAPDRKEDPGELFDWERLARAGIGIWPEIESHGPDTPPLQEVQAELAAIGYAVEATGLMDLSTRAALVAFQRHWLSGHITAARDAPTASRLRQVRHAMTGTVASP